MKRISISVLCIFALSLPIAASALTAEEIQQQIAQLLAQIEVLQQQIAQTSTIVVNNGNSTAGTACFRAYRNLFRGLRGSDVEELQRFLLNTSDFTFGEITGYFGSATELAVQKFQCRELGICSGSPDTNGYGFVGARTRAAMSARCSTQTMQTQATPATVFQCPNIAQPSCTNGTLTSLGNDTNGCHRGWLCEIRTVVQNNAPRLELSGPGSLWLNETGTWTVKATDPDGDNISVSMFFGNETTNEILQELAYPTSSKSFTRTRAFSTVGSYSIRVDVLDTFNNSARITSVVQVRGHSCAVNSTTLEHGTSRIFYSQSTPSSGSTCTAISQSRTCNNGTVSGGGSYQYTSCTEAPASSTNASCLDGDGVSRPHGTQMMSCNTQYSTYICSISKMALVQFQCQNGQWVSGTQSTSGNSSCIVPRRCGDLTIPNGACLWGSAGVITLRAVCTNGTLLSPAQLGLTSSGTCPTNPPSYYQASCPGDEMPQSDVNTKTNISSIQEALSKLSQLNGIFFNWKDSSISQERQMGVIAQEVQKVFPEAVIESNGVLYVNYYSLIAPIIEALKELKFQNDALQAEIEVLKNH